MKVLEVSVKNFGSYKSLDFDFRGQNGLTLIQGPTGSGKSTFCDIIPWILFGRTAKGGTVDEVRSWNTSEVTEGFAIIEYQPGFSISITRKRKPNDLYYSTEDLEFNRGKDLQDTQKIINSILGMDFDLYLASSYYQEFSQTAQFFTTNAKTRRQICEQLVDLTMAVRLQDKLKECLKSSNLDAIVVSSDLLNDKNTLNTVTRLQTIESEKHKNWENEKINRLIRAANQYQDFEDGRKKTISNVCRSCGTVLQKPKTIIDDSPNPFENRILEIESEKNPHSSSIKDFSSEIHIHKINISNGEEELNNINQKIAIFEKLQDITEAFRSASIVNTIRFVESETNQLLTDHFDAEIKVEFQVEAADKVEVTIHKDGNVASFTQLSKGQRQLLKLSFGIAVMKAIQNHHSIRIDSLYFDEATDGLDEQMKLKALRMLETLTLNYTSIYLVEHSEALKNMVSNRYEVTLTNGESHIAEA